MITSVVAAGAGGVATASETAPAGEQCTVTVSGGDSIQNAIAGADAGETICVETAVYSEQLVIGVDNLTVAAANGGKPVLEGSGGGTGVEVDSAENVTVRGFEIREYDTALSVENSPNTTLETNTITENDWAIRDQDTASHGMEIVDNQITDNGVRGIFIQRSDDVRIAGNHIENNGHSGAGSGYSIQFRGGSSAVIEHNTITDSNVGAFIWTADATVANNTISDHTTGIHLRSQTGSGGADNAVIEDNTLDDVETGVLVSQVSDTEIRNNVVTGTSLDVELSRASTVSVFDNEFDAGVVIDGSEGTFSHFDHEMGNNMVGGDPLVFVKDAHDPDIPTDAGQILVVDSTNVEIADFEFDGIAAGIQIAYSPDALVTDNSVSNTTSHAIHLWSSNGATVSDNELLGNGETSLVSGIGVYGSTDAVVSNNSVTDGDGRALSVGSSPEIAIQENTFADNYAGLRLSGSDHASITNNTITGTHHGGTTSNFRSAILVTSGEHVEIRENTITDNHVNGIHDNRGAHSQYVEIVDNVVTDNGNRGIYWTRSHDATITNNTVADNGGAGISGPMRATVTNNTVTGNWDGIEASHDSLVSANVVEDNAGHGIDVNADSVVRDNTITNSGGDGIFLRYFDGQTIENNVVSGHDTDLHIYAITDVTVRDNTFETGVALRSWSVDVDELTSHSFVNNTVGGGSLFYAHSSDDPTIPADAGQVIVANSTNVDVSGLTLENATAGVQVAFSDGVNVSDNTVTNSAVSLERGTLTFWGSNDVSVHNNTLDDLRERSAGVEVTEGENVDISNNTITGGEWDGIVVADSSTVSLTHNDIADNERNGIHVDGGDELDVTSNTVSGSASSAISTSIVSGGDANISDNTVTDNHEGIVVSAQGWNAQLDDVLIASNVVEDNSAVGIQVEDEAVDVRVVDNEILGNGDGVVYDDFNPDYDLNATNNWWGDATGPSGGVTDPETGTVADGSGDSVDENVLFDPWLDGEPSDDVFFDVTIDSTNSPVDETDSLTVVVTVENTGSDPGTQTVSLADFDDSVVDTSEITLDDGQSTTVGLTWETQEGDAGTDDITVTSEDDSATETVTISEPESQQIVITEPGVFELEEDLTFSGGEDAVIVDSDDVVFEGNDHVLVSESGGTGITANDVTNVTVRDLTLDGWQYGFEFEHVENAHIEAVTADDIGQTGIWLSTVSNSTVQHNTLLGNRDGIVLREGSFGNTIENNTAEDNRRYGTVLRGSSENTLANNTFAGSESQGVMVNQDSYENTFVANTVIGTGEDRENGFRIDGDRNELRDNVVSDTERENFRIVGDENTFVNNTATGGDREGIRVVDGDRNSFEGNTVTESASHGIRLWNAFDNTFVNDTVAASGGFDFYLYGGSSNNSVSSLTIAEGTSGTMGTTLSLDGIDVGIGATETIPTPPDERASLGAYFDASDDTFASTLDVEIPYETDELGDIDPQTLELWHYDEGDETWDVVPGSSVNTTAQVVTAEITSFSTFGVFGEETDTELAVLNASVSPTAVEPGDSVTVDATVENVGSADGNLTVPLVIDGSVEDSKTVSLAVNETKSVSFTHTFDEAGEFDVFVDTVEAGTVSVVEGADIIVYGASVDSTTVQDNETVTVTGYLFNDGSVAGNETVALSANGDVVDETTVTVDGGAITSVELEWVAFLPEGMDNMSFDLTLDGFFVETVTVVNQYSDIQVIAASVSDVELIEGEKTYVIGSIYQAGNIEGTEEIELTATHNETGETEVVGSQTVTLSPGFYHLGALNVTFEPEEAGYYDLELGGRNAGGVEVEAAESDIQVIAASVSDIELIQGEETHVIGSIYQAGNIEGTEEIELTATHNETGETEVVGSQTVTLSPGFYHLGALNVTFEPAESGHYDLELGERNAGGVEVEAAESDIRVIAASVSDIELIQGEETHVIGSIYQAGNIEGTEDIELTATHNVTGETEVVGSQEVTLSPGFYHLGALNVTFEPEESGYYDLELGERNAGGVEVEAAESDIQVIAASVSDIELIEGEETYVIGSIYQAGNIEGTEEIELTATHNVTGETKVVGSQTVTLSPGFYHLGALNVTFEPAEAGHYDLELGERNAGSVEVEAAESDIRVIGASTSDVEITEGEQTHIVGSIYQAGNIEGTEEIELTATHNVTGETEVVGSQNVTLAPGYYLLGAVNITFEPDEAGYYDLELGGRNAGTVFVEELVTDIQVIAASTSDVEIIEGETTHVIGSVYQNGTDEATEVIELVATDENGTETVVGSQEVTVPPGTYHLGAINISFEPDEPGYYDLELGERGAGWVDVEPAVSDIQVIAASTSEVELVQGEEVTHVIGSIYQAGNIEGTEEIELTATHNESGETEVVGTQTVTLSPGFYHLGALNITFDPAEPGHYDLELGGRNAGWVEVEAAESDIQVIAASTSAVELVQGEEVTHVIGSIYQAGNIEGTEEIELTATHNESGETEVVGTQNVTLSPGFYHLGALNVTFDPAEPGHYDLELGGRDAGWVEVEAAESDIRVIAASVSGVNLVEGTEMYVIGSIYQSGNIEGTEEIELTATNQGTGETEVVGSQEVTLAPGFYHLGALNVTFELAQPGTYSLELGERDAGAVEVNEASVEPKITAVNGYSEGIDPETELETTYASDDATVDITVESDLALDQVTLLVRSVETTYTVGTEATHVGGESWQADLPFDDIPDDGAYTLSVIAIDVLGNAGFDNLPVVMIDREPPSMAATVEDVDSDDATVVVESDEALSTVPDVEVERPDGSTVTLSMTEETTTRFTGTLEFEGSGNYTVETVGTDLAGNEGTDTASVVVDTRFTLADGLIGLEGTGTTVEFTVADDVSDSLLTQELFLAFSENTVDANVDDGDVGGGFLTGELDGVLDQHFEQGTITNATVSMAIDEDALGDADAEDVELHHYDGVDDSWSAVDSTVTHIDNDPFVVGDVTSFSTYGALVSDTDGPTLVDVWPAPNAAVGSDDGTISIEFEYVDTLSGVDLSSVAFAVDGVDVTDAEATQITSETATHTLDVEPDTAYTATVTVADRAGNEETFETNFETGNPDAHFGVTITDTNSPVDAGETLTVEFDVENDWGQSDTQEIVFEVEGVEEDSVTMTLDGTETRTETFTYEPDRDDVGELEVAVSSADEVVTETVEVGYGVVTYADGDGVVDTTGLLNAIGDWRSDDIETSLLLDVINAWRSGEPVI